MIRLPSFHSLDAFHWNSNCTAQHWLSPYMLSKLRVKNFLIILWRSFCLQPREFQRPCEKVFTFLSLFFFLCALVVRWHKDSNYNRRPRPASVLHPCQVFSRCDLCFINIKSDLLAMKICAGLKNLACASSRLSRCPAGCALFLAVFLPRLFNYRHAAVASGERGKQMRYPCAHYPVANLS